MFMVFSFKDLAVCRQNSCLIMDLNLQGTENFNCFGFPTLYCIYFLGKTELIYFDLYMHICIVEHILLILLRKL